MSVCQAKHCACNNGTKKTVIKNSDIKWDSDITETGCSCRTDKKTRHELVKQIAKKCGSNTGGSEGRDLVAKQQEKKPKKKTKPLNKERKKKEPRLG